MVQETDSILKLVQKYRPGARVSIRHLGSFVNDVFLIDVDGEKLVAKRYTNWVSLKWLTLNLYGLGSVKFSISGKRRMEAEYAFNYSLSRQGLKVPRILFGDTSSRTIFFAYVPGDGLSNVLVNLARSGEISSREKIAAYSAGELVAQAHEIETALGDTKPENFIVDRKGDVTLVDLEQARYRGDYSWDVAEFLFYSGHYWLPFNETLAKYVDSFVEGYLSKNAANILHKAGSPKYLRVFSVWTPPNIILQIRKKLVSA